jgi:hypothetical protein
LRTGASERDRRHWKLEEAREADVGKGGSEAGVSKRGRRRSTVGVEESSGTPRTMSHISVDRDEVGGAVGLESVELEAALELPKEMDTQEGLDDEVVGLDMSRTGDVDLQIADETESLETEGVSSGLQFGAGTGEAGNISPGEDAESSGSSDVSDTSETSDTSEDEEDSDEDEDEEDEAMERLLIAAKNAAIAKSASKDKGKAVEVVEGDDEVVLQFDAAEGARAKQAYVNYEQSILVEADTMLSHT